MDDNVAIVSVGTFIFLLMVIIILLFGLGCPTMLGWYKTEWTEPVKVIDKTTKYYNKGSKYLIFTDKEVFEVTDSFGKWRFNSSDIFGRIQKGKIYKFKVFWKRIRFLSMYRDILDFKEVK